MGRENWGFLGHGGESAEWMTLFRPRALEKWQGAVDSERKFIYYTSAETALKIIRNEEIWMRSMLVMNDYQEIEYARNCLLNAMSQQALPWLQHQLSVHKWSTDYQDFIRWLNVAGAYQGNSPHLFCFSEHDEIQDPLGRLSMWRAYGGGNGVALIFRGSKFLEATDPHGTSLTPVEYLTPEELSNDFALIWPHIRDQFVPPGTGRIDQDWGWNIYRFINYCLLTVKHPGFKEEREWRMVIDPGAGAVRSGVETVAGVPQLVLKFPLKDDPDMGVEFGPFRSLLEGVVVGPSTFPDVIANALRTELQKKHYSPSGSDPYVKISGIPLRV